MNRITYAAPRRDSIATGQGTFTTKPWSKQAVEEYKKVGGWFCKGRHDFEDRAAAMAAGVGGVE